MSYVWWAQRRGYAQRTLNEAQCDIWPGVASGVQSIATTLPYYRSTYVFVTRTDRALQGVTLDDTRLKSLAIGVQMIGDNATNTPPAHALASRGLIGNVHGAICSTETMAARTLAPRLSTRSRAVRSM